MSSTTTNPTDCTVIGASGLIGSSLVDRLCGDGHAVRCICCDSPLPIGESLGHVFYCAGVTGDFRDRPRDTVESHIALLARMLESARFDALVYCSSTRVYGQQERGEEHCPSLTLRPHEPDDLYAASKLTGELLCRSMAPDRTRIARLSNVVNPHFDGPAFLDAIVRSAGSGHIVLRADPRSTRDLVLLDDVTEMLVRIAFDGMQHCYNIATGMPVTHEHIARAVQSVIACEIERPIGGERIRSPIISIERLQAEFGYAPADPLAALPDLVRQYLKSEPDACQLQHAHTQ